MRRHGRRLVIKLASCAGMAAGWGRAGFSAAPSRRTAFGPNDKLRHACIGVGGMGFNDLRNFLSHPRVEVVALCDVDANNLAKAAKLAPNAHTYTDWREMLEKEGDAIDSVNVAVPDHQHAIISTTWPSAARWRWRRSAATWSRSSARSSRRAAATGWASVSSAQGRSAR